uniref:Uncharacterized protein n=1 Tax=Globisporangium ultimum (strain ATCC 200006 / CBS 805.95 / DAOM BR144) TaxID=431595 RepID=K3W7R5_GLOUD
MEGSRVAALRGFNSSIQLIKKQCHDAKGTLLFADTALRSRLPPDIAMESTSRINSSIFFTWIGSR